MFYNNIHLIRKKFQKFIYTNKEHPKREGLSQNKSSIFPTSHFQVLSRILPLFSPERGLTMGLARRFSK